MRRGVVQPGHAVGSRSDHPTVPDDHRTERTAAGPHILFGQFDGLAHKTQRLPGKAVFGSITHRSMVFRTITFDVYPARSPTPEHNEPNQIKEPGKRMPENQTNEFLQR